MQPNGELLPKRPKADNPFSLRVVLVVLFIIACSTLLHQYQDALRSYTGSSRVQQVYISQPALVSNGTQAAGSHGLQGSRHTAVAAVAVSTNSSAAVSSQQLPIRHDDAGYVSMTEHPVCSFFRAGGGRNDD
eukprot:jgi/Chrzof1/4594/Cz14g19160.t1